MQKLVGGPSAFEKGKNANFDTLISSCAPSLSDGDCRKMMTISNSNFESCLKKIILKIEASDKPKEKKKKKKRSSSGGDRSTERKKPRPSEAANDAPSDIDVVEEEEEAKEEDATTIQKFVGLSEYSFLCDDDSCTRQVVKGGAVHKIPQHIISWKGYPEVEHWEQVRESADEGMVELAPSVSRRPLTCQLCKCSGELLVDVLAQDKKNVRLMFLDWSDRELDKKELKSLMSSMGKANEDKVWNFILIHNVSNFFVVQQLFNSTELPNLVEPTPLFIKLVDNPSQGSVTHSEHFRSDGNWGFAGHFDFRTESGGNKAKKSTKEHYPITEVPKKFLDLLPHDFASMCVETYAPNSRLAKQHNDDGVLRSHGFTSHIVSFFFFLIITCTCFLNVNVKGKQNNNNAAFPVRWCTRWEKDDLFCRLLHSIRRRVSAWPRL